MLNDPLTRPAPTSIARLLAPRSIAIAGVSASGQSLGAAVLDTLERFGFSGAIHLIHPGQATLRDRPCVPTPAALPFGVDCVVLAIPAAAVVEAVRGCAARGVGGVVVFAAGFAELGEAGRAMQDDIAAIANAAGMAIEGPNCLGYLNDVDGLALTFAASLPRPVPRGARAIAVLSQSGALTTVLRAALHGRALPVSIALSTGNEACCGIEAFAAHLLGAPETAVIAIIAEHIRAPARFLALARAATQRGIPLVMLHPGRSAAARAAAQTHTGAMTGDDAVMRAQAGRAGVLIAETLEELVDLCECLWRWATRPAHPAGVAVLCESGAFKALALDYAATLGLSLPPPHGAAASALNAIAPGFILASNPLDLTAQALGDPGLYAQAIALLMENPACNTLLVCIILTSAAMAERKMPPVIAAMRAWAPRRRVLFAMLGEDAPIPEPIIAAVRQAGVPFLRSPERAMRVLARLAACQPPPPAPTQPAPAQPALECSTARLPAGVMTEHAAKQVLAAAGLRVPQAAFATDQDAACAAARRIGFPLALKVHAPGLTHKSDVGGVLLDRADADAVATGFDQLMRIEGAAGVLVEAMAPPGLEMIVGARRDAGWGAIVTVGLGGVTAEALADIQVLPSDCSPDEVTAALHRLRGAPLLGAFRGRPARDTEALANAVVAVGQLMAAHPEITELDLNPMLVFAPGEGTTTLDAVIACG